jgi:chromosome segregation and condensation protein ScpB
MTNNEIVKIAECVGKAANCIESLKKEIEQYKSLPVKTEIDKIASNYKLLTGKEIQEGIKTAMENNEELRKTIANTVGSIDYEDTNKNLELTKKAEKRSPREEFDDFLNS